MIDKTFFTHELLGELVSNGGGPSQTIIHLINGQSYDVRMVLAASEGYVVVEVYPGYKAQWERSCHQVPSGVDVTLGSLFWRQNKPSTGRHSVRINGVTRGPF